MSDHDGVFDWFMGRLYDGQMAVVEEACLGEWRSELIGPLRGDVLEIGAGTGLNLPYYSSSVSDLVLTEPSPHMRRGLQARLDGVAVGQVEVQHLEAEDLPFDDDQFDHVVSTLVLCTVRDPVAVVSELFRVLKPGGSLVYLEHVLATDNPGRAVWQARLEPLWKVVACGCHLTRDTDLVLRNAGFDLNDQVRESMRKVIPIVRATIRGRAVKPGAGAS
jgi:ubiquinone/menaquinone biosynthesis C-methylase UbiE